MSSLTPNFDLILPGVNDPSDQDLWGGYLNSNFETIDTVMKNNQDLAGGNTSSETTDFNVTSADQNTTFLVDCSAGNVIASLADVTTLPNGFRVGFKKIDSSSNTLTLEPSGSQTIDDAANYVLSGQYDYQAIEGNTVEWYKISPDVDLPLASAAETLAGVSTILGISPAGFAGNKSLSSSGYYKFPGGFIVQWGTGVDNTTVSLPVAFSNTDYVIVGNWYNSIPAGASSAGVVIDNGSVTTTGFKAWIGSAGSPDTYRWIAIGY